MLEKVQIKEFETEFFNLAKEQEYATEQKKTLASVFDEMPTKNKRQELLNKIFDKSMSKDEKLEQGLDPSTEENLQSQDVDRAQETRQDDSTSPVTPSKIVDEEIEKETIEDDIDEIENINLQEEESGDAQKEEVDGSVFSLPPEYLVMPSDDSEEEEEEGVKLQAEEEQGELDLEEILGDAESLFLDDDEDINIQEESYTNEELSAMYGISEDFSDKGDKYHSARDFQIEDEELFFEKLSSYNFYLKRAITEIILNDEAGKDSQHLVDLILSEGIHRSVLRRECEKILNVPLHSLSDEVIYTQQSLRARLTTLITQVQKTTKITFTQVLPIAAAIAIVAFYGFFFAIQPIRAWRLYEAGYKDLQERQYEASEDKFIKAASIYAMNGYFFKYADWYLENKNFVGTRTKYNQLLFGTNEGLRTALEKRITEEDFYTTIEFDGKTYAPIDLVFYSPEGFRKIVDFEIDYYGDFKKAKAYYNVWLDVFRDDGNAYINLADVYTEWYDRSGDSFLLEQSKVLYDKAIVVNDNDDKSLISRVRWAIRTQEKEYISDIQDNIVSLGDRVPELVELKPFIELVQYKLDENDPYYTADILDQISRVHPAHSDLPYLYARYYGQTNQPVEQIAALQEAMHVYDSLTVLSDTQKSNQIDTYISLANILFEYNKNLLGAEEYIMKAQLLFEEAQNSYLIRDNAYLTRLYFLRSRLELAQGDVAASSHYLVEAKEKKYDSISLRYHSGLISYLNGDWENASNYFLKLVPYVKENEVQYNTLLLGIANSLFNNKNYAGAVVHYKQLLERINRFKEGEYNITTINIAREVEDVALFTHIARIKNNLGVALYYDSQQTLNGRNKFIAALNEFRESSSTQQNLERDGNFVRQAYQELATLNFSSALDFQFSVPIEIYPEIAYYLESNVFWREQVAAITP